MKLRLGLAIGLLGAVLVILLMGPVGWATGSGQAKTAAVLWQDNFDDLDWKGWVATLVWHPGDPAPGSWTASGGELVGTGCRAEIEHSMTTDPTVFSDFDLDLDARLVSGWKYQIYFRGAYAADCYAGTYQRYEFWYDYAAGAFYLQRGGPGMGGVILDQSGGSLDNAGHHIRIRAVGSTIECYVDGGLVLQATDEALTQGFIGFNTSGASGSESHFDNVVVSEPSPPDAVDKTSWGRVKQGFR